MPKSDYLRDEQLKWEAGLANALDDGLIVPHLQLVSTMPTASAAGTAITGGGMTRISAAGKLTLVNHELVLTAVASFPTPTANLGNAVAVELWTALSGGNRLKWAPLQAAKALNANDPVSFPANKLIFRE